MSGTLDHQVDELLRGEIPWVDAPARERARVRLMSAITREEITSGRGAPEHRGRRWALSGAVAAAVVIVSLLQMLLPSGSGGPRPGAAAEIYRLGELSASQPALELASSRHLYRQLESRSLLGVTPLGGEPIMLRVATSIESWVSPDGSGETITTYHRVSFLTDADRQRWEDSGSALPIPRTWKPVTETFGPGELPFYGVSDLPADPEGLREALLGGAVVATGDSPSQLLEAIGKLLSYETVAADARRGLFQLAGTLIGVTVQRSVTDPIGRDAVAVSVVDSSGRTTLFFDPSTASLLAQSGEIGPDEVSDWQVYVRSDVVDAIGERPGEQTG